MSKIVTVTMNAAMDKRYEVERLIRGEVVRVISCENSAGGKGINVSRVLRLLGAEVAATGIAGGHTGEYLLEELGKLGIEDRFYKASAETRACINLYDRSSGCRTELLEPGGTVSPEEAENFYAHFRKAVQDAEIVAISGSCVKGFPGNVYRKLIGLCNGKKVFLDASGEALSEGLAGTPYLAKPNIHELAAILKKDERELDVAAEAERFRKKGISQFAVSCGEDGCVFAGKSGTYRALAPKVNAVNTVGCGDSMVAGFVYAELSGMGDEEKLRFATAVAAANAMQERTGYIEVSDVTEIYNRIKIIKM